MKGQATLNRALSWWRKDPVRSVQVRQQRIRLVVRTHTELFRADTYSTKEPMTLDWIDAMDPQRHRLCDVGANVGLYSLYAAARGISVVAVEAEAANAARLQQHVALNGLQDRITVVLVAAAGHEGLGPLYLAQLQSGAANHNFAAAADCHGRPFTPAAVQHLFATTLDRLVFTWGLPQPTHLKIDVDGIEPAILNGASRILQDGVESVLIEREYANQSEITATLTMAGFEAARTEPIIGYEAENVVFAKHSIPTPVGPR